MFLLDITVPSASVGHGVWGVGMTLSVECGEWISTQPLASARLVYWPPYWWVWLVGWSMDAGRYFWTSGSNCLVLSDRSRQDWDGFGWSRICKLQVSENVQQGPVNLTM